MRVAVLDDYQGASLKLADWGSLPDVAVVPFKDHVHDAWELIARLADFDAVLRIRERTPLTKEVIHSLPRLRLILATGMRNARSLDLAAADERGIVVSTTDALHQTTVEVTWALLLALFRRIPQETASLRAGGWQVGLGQGLEGKTLGIIGLGNMGIPVARIAKCFGMRVVAWSRNLTEERAAAHGVEAVSKRVLLESGDAVTIHLPHSPETEGLVAESEFRLMKRTAYLVNTSRPQIVSEQALIAALSEGTIAGAGLDVFDVEPLPLNHPFRQMPNIVATPHIGFVTQENYRKFFEESRENLEAFLKGAPIRTITAQNPFLPNSQVAKQMHSRSLA